MAEIETHSPDMPLGSSSLRVDDDHDGDDEAKDDSWMQFIIDDAWCSNVSNNDGGDEPSCVAAVAN